MSRQRSRTISRFKLLLIAMGAAALMALLYAGAQWLDDQRRQPEVRSSASLRYDYEPTIEVDGAAYRMRRDVTSILLMGIDCRSTAVSQGYRNGGQADFLRLLVLDSKQKTVHQLPIDRDTMTPIVVLGVLGDRSGTRNAQISLSHGFGDGGAQSCKLTVEAVSNLLLGSSIDFYMSLDMAGISVLNDLAGGVTVTLEDDFSMADPAMTKGTTLTLQGEQAEIFVRGRMELDAATNAARMKRQQQYIQLLTEKLDETIGEDKDRLQSLLDAMEPYMITDMAKGRMINELWAAKDYQRLEPTELKGTHSVAPDGFMQFQADQADLQRAVLELFYEKVE